MAISISRPTIYTPTITRLQISWAHQASRASIQVNYTYGKALGIVGSGTTLGSFGATLDPFNLQNNYGAQTGDRRHIFNAAYSINLPSPIHGNKIAAGVVNGWQLSGITQLESGANLTNNSGFNFNWQLNGAIIPGTENVINSGGTNGIPINNQSLLGTSSIQLNPILTCNPTQNLAPHQFINGNCFAVPTQIGENGPSVMPAFYGPAFFNSDLGLFKNFQIKESMKLQFRVQAQNFLNHPLWSFPNTNNLTLQFKPGVAGQRDHSANKPEFRIHPIQAGPAHCRIAREILLLMPVGRRSQAVCLISV